jgi:hypothetical protein
MANWNSLKKHAFMFLVLEGISFFLHYLMKGKKATKKKVKMKEFIALTVLQ